MEAVKAKSFYDQGQQDLSTQQAQQELDTKVEGDVNQVAQEQQLQQQQQMMGEQQQAATQEATTKAVAKEQANETVASLKTPDSITGAKPKPKKKSQPASKSEGKGVTIKIGK